MIISFFGGIEIDVVGLDEHPVLDEVDRQLGVPSEELVHQALEVGREVLDDDERHPACPAGTLSKKRSSASSPPADAPMPTM